MKPLFLILLSFFLLSFGGNKPKNDLDKEHLKGKVSSVKGYVHYEVIVHGNILKDSIKIKPSFRITKDSVEKEYSYKFNNAGYEIEYDDTIVEERRDTSIKEHPSRHRREKYNDKGSIIQLDDYYNGMNRHIHNVYDYKYDGKGFMIMQLDSNQGGFCKYKNNANGNVIKAVWHWPNGQLGPKTIYKYDKNGNNIFYKGHSNIPSKDRYRYIFKYDNKNKLLWSKAENNYKFNKPLLNLNTNVIKYSKFFFYRSKYIYTSGYDKNGDIIYETSSDISSTDKKEQNSKWEYHYENYDSAGNWLKQIQIRNDTIMTVTERIIEYYK